MPYYPTIFLMLLHICFLFKKKHNYKEIHDYLILNNSLDVFTHSRSVTDHEWTWAKWDVSMLEMNPLKTLIINHVSIKPFNH